MKNAIVIITLISSIFCFASDVEAATAVGKAPANTVGAQARIMARRAAQVIMMRDNGGRVPQIISEKWDETTKEYSIEY